VGQQNWMTALFCSHHLSAKWLADTSDFYFLSAQGPLSKSVTYHCENLNDLTDINS